MRTYLVTGAAGFIGSHLCEKLVADGNKVFGIDNFDEFYSKKIKLKNLEKLLPSDLFNLLECDIRDLDSLEHFLTNISPDVYIHLAAKAGVLPSIRTPYEYIKTNIDGTYNLLEIIRRKSNGKKLIFASSSSIYGNNKKTPFVETDPVEDPISPYAFTKKSCELLNHTYHHLYGIDIINLRLFTVYGPRQRPDLAIHKFVDMILKNEPVTMYGDGNTSRDYTFVNDTISGFLGAIDYIVKNENVFETVNLGNHNPVKLSELIQTIYSLLGRKPDIKELHQQSGDVEITYADISKAVKLFNYHPKTTLHEGISAFIKWHNQNL